MANEWIWLIMAIVNFILVIAMYAFFGKSGLIAWIAVGTLLANIQVTKQITLFGMSATLGNIMYGTIFLATDALNEKYGVKIAKKGVWIGFFTLLISIIVMRFALWFTPNEIDFAHDALATIFAFIPRIAFASLIAYIASQYIDVMLFQRIKKAWPSDKLLFLRNNGSTLLSQFIDTAIFVPLAFIGMSGFSTDIIIDIFITTYIIKVFVAALDTPFLYLIKHIKPMQADL